MEDWNIRKLPFGGKLAVSVFLCAVGVGYLFALGQLINKHGEPTYGNVVRDYYGTPAMRDSIDAYWAGVRKTLVEKWNAGERGQTKRPERQSTELSLDDLEALDEPTGAGMPEEFTRMLASAGSLDRLESMIESEHESDLQVKLGIPTVSSLVSLGHTHTFGHLGFLMPVSVLLLFTSLPWTTKGVLACVPLVGIILDYPSALLTRLVAPEFALVLMLAGALMGVGFLIGFVVGMYDLWFKRT